MNWHFRRSFFVCVSTNELIVGARFEWVERWSNFVWSQSKLWIASSSYTAIRISRDRQTKANRKRFSNSIESRDRSFLVSQSSFSICGLNFFLFIFCILIKCDFCSPFVQRLCMDYDTEIDKANEDLVRWLGHFSSLPQNRLQIEKQVLVEMRTQKAKFCDVLVP